MCRAIPLPFPFGYHWRGQPVRSHRRAPLARGAHFSLAAVSASAVVLLIMATRLRMRRNLLVDPFKPATVSELSFLEAGRKIVGSEKEPDDSLDSRLVDAGDGFGSSRSELSVRGYPHSGIRSARPGRVGRPGGRLHRRAARHRHKRISRASSRMSFWSAGLSAPSNRYSTFTCSAPSGSRAWFWSIVGGRGTSAEARR